ncbi:hypothetical protein HRbin36_00508 [bacterium HR36]|nr:hypothetical protein HRbin36_00508 [bacterium HR36]
MVRRKRVQNDSIPQHTRRFYFVRVPEIAHGELTPPLLFGYAQLPSASI